MIYVDQSLAPITLDELDGLAEQAGGQDVLAVDPGLQSGEAVQFVEGDGCE